MAVDYGEQRDDRPAGKVHVADPGAGLVEHIAELERYGGEPRQQLAVGLARQRREQVVGLHPSLFAQAPGKYVRAHIVRS